MQTFGKVEIGLYRNAFLTSALDRSVWSGFHVPSIHSFIYLYVHSSNYLLPSLCSYLYNWVMSPHIFQKSRSYQQYLSARRAIWRKFRTEDSQFGNDMWTSLLSGAFSSMHLKRYTFLYVGENTAISVLTISGATVKKNNRPGDQPLGMGVPLRFTSLPPVNTASITLLRKSSSQTFQEGNTSGAKKQQRRLLMGTNSSVRYIFQ